MKTSNGSSSSESNDSSDGDKPQGFWDKNKKWIKPTAIGLTGLGLVFIGIKIMKSKPPAPTAQLTGMKSRRKKKRGGHKGKKKKQAVAYM